MNPLLLCHWRNKNSLSLLLELFPVQQVIYLEITFSSYVYPSLVIYFLKVLALNSLTEDSKIQHSLTVRFFWKSLILWQYTYESLQATKFVSEGGVFSTEPDLSHGPFPFFSCCIYYSGQEQFFLLVSHPSVPMTRAYWCVQNTFITFIDVKTTLETKCMICVY